MTKVFANPNEIKSFLKYVIHTQMEAYFEQLNDNSEMLLAITDTQWQAEKIQSFLLRSSVLSDRHSLAVAVQRLPGPPERGTNFPVFGVFYVSVHTKEERAKIMNTVLVNAVTRILGAG